MERLSAIRKNSFISFLVLILISFNSISQPSKKSFSLNGYVKYLPSYVDYSFFDKETNHLFHNRINMRGYFGDNLSLGLEVRNRIYFGDVPTIQGDEGLVNMAFYAVRESNFVFNSTCSFLRSSICCLALSADLHKDS